MKNKIVNLCKVVATRSGANNSAAISTQNIPDGMYFVKINDLKGNETTTRVVVRH
jgi:hypothetical protein